jgi:16S rRNA (cytosine967-C5)-methyltransferase
MNSRAKAAKIIEQVIVHKHALTDKIDDPFTKNLCYGTVRWYFQLKVIADKLLHKPLAEKHQDVFCVLLVGLYQLEHLTTKQYAAISETVNAVKALKKPWAAGLINKTLRRFCEERDKIISEISPYAHPAWLTKKIKSDWPEDYKAILEANNQQAPMTLRVNPMLTSVDGYLKQLADNNIPGQKLTGLPFAIQLEHPVDISKLPYFEQGACYVQDEAGQYASQLLKLTAELRVLDACASPGSKTTDILISEPDLKELVAVDNENMDRLKIPKNNARLILGDASQPNQWWDKKLFDRILIDAPCSATGVIRRHPDIKILRRSDDIIQQAAFQLTLLNALWPLLKPGGLLLYSTCSILKEENENNIVKFIQKHSDAKPQPIQLPNAKNVKFGAQMLPTINGPDGFYYLLFQKA